MAFEMNNMLIPGSAGEICLYQDGKAAGSVPRFVVSLTMSIRENELKNALSDVIVLFPQLAAGVRVCGESLELYPVNGTIPVTAVSEAALSGLHIGGPETGGYLFHVTYSGKSVFFDWHLALCDERGMSEFVKAVIFRYLQLCGYDISNDGSVKEVHSQSTMIEGLDPYVRLEDIPASRPVWYMDAKAFSAPFNEGESDYVYQIRIPISKIKGQVRQYISQPEAFISPLFSHVLYEKYRNEIGDGEYIVSFIRENLRPHFPSASLRLFFSPLTLAYNRNLEEYPISTILMSQKKLLDAQLRNDALAYSAHRLVEMTEGVCDSSLSLSEKISHSSLSLEKVSKTATFSICNLGNTVMPETLQQYITEFYPIFPAAGFAYSLTVVNFKGELLVTVATRDGDRSLPFRFASILNSQDVYAFVADEFRFNQLDYIPKTK